MPGRQPRPQWLRKEKKLSSVVIKRKKAIADLGLNTVCESARCPNLSECFSPGTGAGNATFLILGNRCTRNCAFCAVDHGLPTAPDKDEGKRIACYIKALNLRFAVITSVTRDDLEDGGASHFVRVVVDIKKALPAVGIELLVPDFGGERLYIERIAGLPVEVFAHNVETVPSLYPGVRKGADYGRSLQVLEIAGHARKDSMLLKSGIMVGLGESEDELIRLFKDLSKCGVDIMTIGQYLRPGRNNLPVRRYYSPDEFVELKETALRYGIKNVVSGSYVRSSYLAEKNYSETFKKNV